MGHSLFDGVRQYAAVEDEVDSMLGYSLRRLCLDDPDGRLKETQFTQPSLYVVNALHAYQAMSEGARPAFAAGHSLGEYNALLVAGVFDFLTGLKLVQKRGEIMAEAKNGGMGAVIGLDVRTIERVLEDSGLKGIDIANFNSPTQTVISGPLDEIHKAGPFFEQAGAQMYVPLQVSAAFHSRYMEGAAKEFAEFIEPMSFAPPRIPVIANATGEPYPPDSELVKELLVGQISHSVQWTKSVRFMLAHGVTTFRELGPGGVLTRMVQQIQHAQAA